MCHVYSDEITVVLLALVFSCDGSVVHQRYPNKAGGLGPLFSRDALVGRHMPIASFAFLVVEPWTISADGW